MRVSTGFRLRNGIVGGATFSQDHNYRYDLWRAWPSFNEVPNPIKDGGFCLWIGMNPSSADESVDDPTVSREVLFCLREKEKSYVKVNVMNLRATFAADLLTATIPPTTSDNVRHIRELAARASRIIVVHGKLHKSLQHHGRDAVEALRRDNRKLYVLGINNDGSPKHPLYLSAETEIKEWII